MNLKAHFYRIPIFITTFWLTLFAMTPLLLMFIISFLSHDELHLINWQFTLANYQQLFSSIFVKIVLQSFTLASIATILILFIAYPTAFVISRAPKYYQFIFLLLLMIPFWTSSLIRTYAIMAVLKVHGLLNTALLYLGIINTPLQIIYTNTAVLLGVIYNLLPFMIIPIYSNLARLDPSLFEAARDLGANRFTLFWRIAIPLTMPGIIVGVLFVFLPAMTLFYIPDLLGGAKSLLLGNLIQNQFLAMIDWPGGSATSVLLTMFMLVLILIYRYFNKRTNSTIDL